MVNFHGRFVWYELMTTNLETAKAFYANVVGWGTRDARLAYSLFTAGDAPVTGLMKLPEDARRAGVTPHWIGYVGVDDVDAVVGQSSSLAERCTFHRRMSLPSAAFRSSPIHRWQRLRWSRG